MASIYIALANIIVIDTNIDWNCKYILWNYMFYIVYRSSMLE